jgi:hypothetical protein
LTSVPLKKEKKRKRKKDWTSLPFFGPFTLYRDHVDRFPASGEALLHFFLFFLFFCFFFWLHANPDYVFTCLEN